MSEEKPLPNSLEEALFEIKELRHKVALLKPLEAISGTLGASIDKVIKFGYLPKVKENMMLAIDDDPRYMVWLEMDSLRIARASKGLRKKMKWPQHKILEASDNVEGVIKFPEIIREMKLQGSNYMKSDSIYRIKAADGRVINFKPYVTIFDAGPFGARVELGELVKLNNFIYNAFFVPKSNKIVLPAKVELTYDLVQKVRAAYTSNDEVAFDTRSIDEVDQKALSFFKRYVSLSDCKFKLIVSPKREKHDEKYADVLDSFVNIGFYWEKMGTEAKNKEKAPELSAPENYLPAPI